MDYPEGSTPLDPDTIRVRSHNAQFFTTLKHLESKTSHFMRGKRAAVPRPIAEDERRVHCET
jgi:hypothetical protein